MFRREDYKRESNPAIVKPHRGSHGGVQTAPKAKLPTQLKTNPCSHCKLPAVTLIKVGNNEFRRLCQKHYNDWKRRNFNYSVKFEKSSDLFNG